jgi:methionyl aminopeptidase
MKARHSRSAFLGYRGFPGHICISINEEVVHGIGGSRVIQDGDVVKIDVGIFYDGWVGDNALTVPVGNVAQETLRLLAATEESLHVAISHARDGEMLGTLCASVEEHVVQHGYTVVREFVGHGVGRKLHEEPQVPNYGKKGGKPRLRAGMTLAIEPMVNMGTEKTRILSDGWTVIATDRKPSAHYEHVVLITEGEPEVLTWRERMFPEGVARLVPRQVSELVPATLTEA